MPTKDPATGPLTRSKFKALVAAPFGEAGKEIQKHDPFWGLKDGEKVKFDVEIKAELYGHATVEASSQKEAERLAEKLEVTEIDWEEHYVLDGWSILSVKPRKRR